MSNAPTPIVDALKGVYASPTTGGMREATCAGTECAKSITQTMIFGLWQPKFCPECNLRAVDAAAQKDRQTAEDLRRAEALKALDVPLLYRDASLESFRIHGDPEDRKRQSRVMQLARRYLAQWPLRQSIDDLGAFPIVTIFRGAPGSGKGHVAWSIAKPIALEYFGRVVFTPLADCVRELRETWRKDSEASENQRLRRYRAADLLIIDEVSRHSFYGEPTQHLYSLVAYREERLLPTILTTNESVESLAGLLGEAVESRAAGWGGVWDFGNADYRIERRRAAQEAA